MRSSGRKAAACRAEAGACRAEAGLILAKRPNAPSPRKRADLLLVERGLFESRARAQAAIEAGLVTANDKQVVKPSEGIPADAVLQAQPAHPFVSRGGVKLSGALEQYPIGIENHVCLDVGASTGGFTEVLLAGGASLVFAIDVGHGQLHPSLHGHPKIVSMEDIDIRSFEGRRLPMRPDVVVIDVSFISLKAVLPVALSLAAAPTHLLALIKPQFEAPRKYLKRGIIRNAMVHQEVCDDITAFAASLGCTDIQVFPSSIAGGDGNIEFFIGARRG
jgi:23S rRNA (cytidine1920-2'-O)/16S rRNA (cytidine1409-2'-O)-methyltransferase